MIELFVSAFALGVLFNVMPGAIFAESLRRGIRGGFGPALGVQVGSLLGDFVWAVLGLAGAAALFALPCIEGPLALVGAALLAWMGWQGVQDAMGPMPAFDPAAGPMLDRSAVAAGAGLSLSNPMNITYWAALGGTISALGIANPGWTSFIVFLGGFMMASVLWCFVCAGAIAWTRRFLNPLAWRLINLGCGAGLALFAVMIVWRIISNQTA